MRSEPLDLLAQSNLIKMHFPGFCTRIARKVLTTHGRLQPNKLCQEYEVRIGYAPGFRPVVFVTDPRPGVEADCQQTPPLTNDGAICVHDPGRTAWN